MRTLTSVKRRELRAKAHHLQPFVIVGQHGLTPPVLHEIDIALTAHELVKIRVFGDDRDARESLQARICAELDAAPVQHLGKILTVWRPAPEPEAPVEKPRATKRAPARKPGSRGGTAAKFVGDPGKRRRRAGAPPAAVARLQNRSKTAGPRARTKPAPAAAGTRRRKRSQM